MVENKKVSEHENLLGQALIQKEIPLQQSQRDSKGRISQTNNSNFKETNLLVVDKKKKFVPSTQARPNNVSIEEEDGVLSIPPEDAANNCKKCCWCLCCLPYYLLCCCLCWKEKEFSARKPDFIKRFTKWIPDRKHNQEMKSTSKDPIPVLIQLYSCEPQAVHELTKCRINPDLTSPVRQDLEFYIPQLISFYLQNYYPNMEQLVNLIVQACQTDFYFSHRIFFQLKSVTFESINDVEKADQQQRAINQVFTSIYEMLGEQLEAQKDNEDYVERLFLPNSRDFVRLLVNFNMIQYHPQLKFCPFAASLNAKQNPGMAIAQDDQSNKQSSKLARKVRQWQEQRLKNVQFIIDEYNTKGWNQQETLRQLNMSIQDDISEDSTVGTNQVEQYKQDFKSARITARDIFLPPFHEQLSDEQLGNRRYELITQQAQRIEREQKRFQGADKEEKSVALKSVFDGYLSTPNFIKRLCEISDGLIGLEDKKTFLMSELMDVNKQLPASVYIPFVNQSMRNYAALHIVAEESRIFKTKERCPLLLCIEVYRPTEISLETIPDVLKAQRTMSALATAANNQRTTSNSGKNFEIQDNNSNLSFNAAQNRLRNKRSQTVHTQLANSNTFPFAIDDEEAGISATGAGGKPANRQSLIISNPTKEKDDDDETDSFVSATDSPSHQQRLALEYKLRAKKQKQAQKKFEELKNERNTIKVSKGFGDLADQRASNPVTLQNAIAARQLKNSVLRDTSMTSGQKKIDENYFNQQFSHTPVYTTSQPPQVILEAMDESERQSSRQTRHKASFQSSGRRSGSLDRCRTLSQGSFHIPISVPIEETKEPMITPEQEDDAYLAKASGMGQTRGMSVFSADGQEEVQIAAKPQNDKSKLIKTQQSSNEPTNLNQTNPVDFFNDRDYYKIFLETSKEQEARIKKNSPFAGLKTWKLLRVIVKTNDDLRQEAFAMQLISQCDQIFRKAKLPLWLKPYEITATGPHCGLIEVVSDALSVSSIKEKVGGANPTIVNYFRSQFGKPSSKKYQLAIENFTNSLCAYSLVCYILQIKDRHNENILIDIEGHVLHIDFGFLLSNAPGKGLKFETAPFKLTQEMLDVMGGENSKSFRDFRNRMARGFQALQANAEKIIILVEMMLMGQSDLPCFEGGRALLRDLKYRLFPNGARLQPDEAQRHVDGLIQQSVNNWRTRCYDRAQYCMQGIL